MKADLHCRTGLDYLNCGYPHRYRRPIDCLSITPVLTKVLRNSNFYENRGEIFRYSEKKKQISH